MSRNRELVDRFVTLIENHDELLNGVITSKMIEEEVNFSKKQFDRILESYSNYTAMQLAEQYRLRRAIMFIHKGNSLSETALRYDYTSTGLSNSIKKKFNLSIENIQGKGFNIEKYVNCKDLLFNRGDFKYVVDQALFNNFLQGLEEEEILLQKIDIEKMRADTTKFEILLDPQKVLEILLRYQDFDIPQCAFDNEISKSEVLLVFVKMCEYNPNTGYSTLRESQFYSYMFLYNFFFKVEKINLNKRLYRIATSRYIIQMLKSSIRVNEFGNGEYGFEIEIAIDGDTITAELTKESQEILEDIERISENW